MKLGLYGGAFNPIHRCHLLVAETAQARLGLDKVLFIPSGDPPHKPPALPNNSCIIITGSQPLAIEWP